MSVINVCGLLVRAKADHCQAIKALLEDEDGIEVHHVTDDGRLIVTVEKESQEQTGETIHKLEKLDHVLSTSMVYQYFDDSIEQEDLS